VAKRATSPTGFWTMSKRSCIVTGAPATRGTSGYGRG
jgi:hypothetical protein